MLDLNRKHCSWTGRLILQAGKRGNVLMAFKAGCEVISGIVRSHYLRITQYFKAVKLMRFEFTFKH